ncbi:hypothetical protein [Lacibacter sediminis]|uniref:Uncharacterized protein n=1 Tax=Lacibacter sediminis TaxID=2760713 RepID=A0A7G5XJU6_9BACT|nr:hypothetical protein [Lacibacter sediminis]QNA45749.1 hypothetical protein H4075_06010 [Lacibacter sediminis]
MGIAVYNAVPMILHDGQREHRFTLKLSPATESFRLESGMIKRSIFIGKRMFNRLFQFVRNEYGYTLGRIQYDDDQMKKGSAITEQRDQFRFTINEQDGIEVMLENEAVPLKKVSATIPLRYENETEKKAHLRALIPSVLAALILTREIQPAL